MIRKDFDAITTGDIQGLLENQVREDRMVEYKSLLPGSTDGEKAEFLADASSFANASGGDLLFGVSATDGIPVRVDGVDGNPDAEVLRLENLLRDCLEPRVTGIRIRPVGQFSKGPVLVIRIPRSWQPPHRVTFKGQSKFFSRNNAGKYPMDMQEIRAAFALSSSLPEKVRAFRDQRLIIIGSGETPVHVNAEVLMVLHILPLAAFGTGVVDLGAAARSQVTRLCPPSGAGFNHRFNLDGLVTFDGNFGKDQFSTSYCQLFRGGQIEAVHTWFTGREGENTWIASTAYEEDTIRAATSYLSALQTLGVPLPLVLLMTMCGVKGCRMSVDRRHIFREETPIDRDRLLLPEVICEDYGADVPRLLQPIFDAVWNACGYERSFNYDKDGNWRPPQ